MAARRGLQGEEAGSFLDGMVAEVVRGCFRPRSGCQVQDHAHIWRDFVQPAQSWQAPQFDWKADEAVCSAWQLDLHDAPTFKCKELTDNPCGARLGYMSKVDKITFARRQAFAELLLANRLLVCELPDRGNGTDQTCGIYENRGDNPPGGGRSDRGDIGR